MKKEPYTRTELDVIVFAMEDVIMSSSIIEEDPGENGGGVLVDP